MNRTTLAIATVTAVTALIGWWVAPAITLISAAVVAAIGALVVWYRLTRSSALVSRWSERARKRDGVATTAQVAKVSSAWAMRRKATTVRPSLADLTWWARLRTSTPEFAMLLARVGVLRAWASVEDVVLVFGVPRTGKSGWLKGRILDAPGAVLATSTRTDLLDDTAAMRAERGPTYVFNAAGLGGRPSTITFDPLTGCTDATIATERATDLLSGCQSGGRDHEFWNEQGRRVLTGLLHAAAIGGRRMQDVLDWVSDPDAHKKTVITLLRQSTEKAFVPAAEQFITTNGQTRSSVTTTIMPAMAWLTTPAAVAATSGEQGFDVAELLASRATVYMLGGAEAHTAPLLSALTGHVAREARRLAAAMPKGRLDPNLLLALDEAALIAPVPLDQWTADMGGRNITIVACFQSRAQLLDRYGEAKAAVIINNAAARMVFGGAADRDDLNYWSGLAGERDEVVANKDASGKVTSTSVRRVPVLPPAQIANLPFGRVIIYRRGMPVALGVVQMAWKRRDVKAHVKATQKQEQAQAREVVATAEHVVRTEPVTAAGAAPAENTTASR